MAVLSESDVEATLIKLRVAEPDKKVDIIQLFGLQLEGVKELPPATIDPFLLLLPPLLRTPHSLLLSSVLSSLLPDLLPLIPNHPTTHLRVALLQILPALIEKLNDAKERVHSAAGNAILTLGEMSWEAEPPVPASLSSSGGKTLSQSTSTKSGKPVETLPAVWERHIRDCLQAKPWRPKVEGMKVLIKLRERVGAKMGLKAWLSVLVDLLEDGDGNVRDQARETVVALLAPTSTPPAARSELKKLLIARNVRKTIAENIIARVLGGDSSSSGRATPAVVSEVSGMKDEVRFGTATPALSQADDVEIVYIASAHDLEREFASMLPHFEGKETEQNWAPRERSVLRIRGMLKGGAHAKFREGFITGLKNGVIEGVGKTVMSLRTTVAQQSCWLLKELPDHLDSGYDHFVEYILPILGKMAGFTKKLIADRSQTAVTAMITHTTVHPRVYITHVSSGIQEKNVQIRHFSCGHLKTFLDVHGTKTRHQIENTAGLIDLLDVSVKKGLADTNPGVREYARQAFWSYHTVFPAKAQTVMDKLDTQARKNLDKVNPASSSSSDSPAATAAPAAAPQIKQVKSGLSALLAEKRKAAREAAAGRKGQDLPRSNSSGSVSGADHLPAPAAIPSNKPSGLLHRSATSPEQSPVSGGRESPFGSPTPAVKTRTSGPNNLLSPQPSRSTTSLGLGRSPPGGSHLSSPRESPLRQSTTVPIDRRTERRKGLPAFDAAEKGGGDVIEAVQGGETPSKAGRSPSGSKEDAASSFLAPPRPAATTPSTPARHLPSDSRNGSDQGHTNEPATSYKTPIHKFRTPANPSRKAAWEDSPRPEAITPKMMAKLKERKHERSWWVKRQELLDKASPLKPLSPAPASAIIPDLDALSEGAPTLRNLQKIALFSTSHPVRPEPEAVDQDEMGLWQEEKKIWEENGLFERMMDDLLAFLKPEKDKVLLEQTLVILWEIVQHQWPLVEDTQKLCQTLFRLRESNDAVILESTNALISLLVQISDPMLLLLNLRASLDRFFIDHPSTLPLASNDATDADDPIAAALANMSLASKETPEVRVKNSGYLFGLSSLGMCVLRLSAPVVISEGPKLGQLITSASQEPSSVIRQAAQSLLLAIQTILRNSSKTLSFVPSLPKGQKDLAIYYMAQNGILEESALHGIGTQREVDRSGGKIQGGEDGPGGEEEEKERMSGELAGLMARGVVKE